jgi:hypothetical protein
METLLQNKNAVIYGAGSAVARAFAREGAKLFLLLIGLGAVQWPLGGTFHIIQALLPSPVMTPKMF